MHTFLRKVDGLRIKVELIALTILDFTTYVRLLSQHGTLGRFLHIDL